MRDKVFISYSHVDKKWVDKLCTVINPLERGSRITLWDDRRIKVGTEWRDEIKKALASTKVAVLLVSPDFLASDFIAQHELPPLLDAAQQEDILIVWIPVRASMYKEAGIEKYQAAINPEKPLAQMRKHKQEEALVEIGERIKEAAGSTRSEESTAARRSSRAKTKGTASLTEDIKQNTRFVLAPSGNSSPIIATNDTRFEATRVLADLDASQSEETGTYTLVLSAKISEVDRGRVEAIVAHLRTIIKDTRLTLSRIEAEGEYQDGRE